MEQQVITEIDQLFQELIVAKLSQNIGDIGTELESLLGEGSDIKAKLDEIPASGGVRSIVSTQLKEIKDQLDDVSEKIDAEKKKLGAVEIAIARCLKQVSEKNETLINDSEKAIKEAGQCSEKSILDSIQEHRKDIDSKIDTSLESAQHTITSSVETEISKVCSLLENHFTSETNQESFRMYFESQVTLLSEKIEKCQDLLAQSIQTINSISGNVVTAKSCTEQIKESVSALEVKAESFSQKSDVDIIMRAIRDNSELINELTNADVLAALQNYKAAADLKTDNLERKIHLILILNIITIIAVVLLFLFTR